MTIRFVDSDVDVDLDRQIEHLRGRSHGTTMPVLDEVKRLYEGARRQFGNLCSHCCGHDICEVVSRGIHDIFGRAYVALARGGLGVEEVFRTAFTVENFFGTQLHADIKNWEAKRVGYRIL